MFMSLEWMVFMNKVKKLFGGLNLTWPKLIIFSVVIAIITAGIALIPGLLYTSFSTIVATLEVWILFGIIIIMNSKSNMDSALKCFVFFLISQPLIYLFQVPFSRLGFGIFQYYKFWFIMTILCLPMGYFGYYIKKDKWYGYLILLPMIAAVLYSYYQYLRYFTFDLPNYILICIFCAVTAIFYPIVLFNNKKIKLYGSIISSIAIIGITGYVIMNPYIYSTEISPKVNGEYITKDYKVKLEDSKYGDLKFEYMSSIDDYLVHCDFKRKGTTNLIITTPEGEVVKQKLVIRRDTYSLKEYKEK